MERPRAVNFATKLESILTETLPANGDPKGQVFEVFSRVNDLMRDPVTFPNRGITELSQRVNDAIFDGRVNFELDGGFLIHRPDFDRDGDKWKLLVPRDFYKRIKGDFANQWGGVINASASLLTLADPIIHPSTITDYTIQFAQEVGNIRETDFHMTLSTLMPIPTRLKSL